MEEPQLQQAKAGSLKTVSWVCRQHAPRLVPGLGTPPGADINPTSRSPASQHQGLTGDSKDVGSSVLPPAAAKAGLVQEPDAEDPWHTACAKGALQCTSAACPAPPVRLRHAPAASVPRHEKGYCSPAFP